MTTFKFYMKAAALTAMQLAIAAVIFCGGTVALLAYAARG